MHARGKTLRLHFARMCRSRLRAYIVTICWCNPAGSLRGKRNARYSPVETKLFLHIYTLRKACDIDEMATRGEGKEKKKETQLNKARAEGKYLPSGKYSLEMMAAAFCLTGGIHIFAKLFRERAGDRPQKMRETIEFRILHSTASTITSAAVKRLSQRH